MRDLKIARREEIAAGISRLLRCRWCVFGFRPALLEQRLQAAKGRFGGTADGTSCLFGGRADFPGGFGNAFASPAGYFTDRLCC